MLTKETLLFIITLTTTCLVTKVAWDSPSNTEENKVDKEVICLVEEKTDRKMVIIRLDKILLKDLMHQEIISIETVTTLVILILF
jgi:hypothetical protein